MEFPDEELPMRFGIDQYVVGQVHAQPVRHPEYPRDRVPPRVAAAVPHIGVIEREERIEDQAASGTAGKHPREWDQKVAGEGDENGFGLGLDFFYWIFSRIPIRVPHPFGHDTELLPQVSIFPP